jgi:glutamate-1-semialdehyde 2,1-aminomutase
MAAGLATLDLVAREGFFETLSARTAELATGLVERARAAAVPLTAQHVGGMFGIFFTHEPKVTRFAQVLACDRARFNRFFHAMLDAGVYLAPSAFEAGFVSAAHSAVDIAETLARADAIFRNARAKPEL